MVIYDNCLELQRGQVSVNKYEGNTYIKACWVCRKKNPTQNQHEEQGKRNVYI